MGKATSFTSDRMFDIEQNSVVSGLVDLNGNLILEKRSGETLNAGHVAGNTGERGPEGAPAGVILAWPAMGIPENWLECNGQEIDRITYSDLFAIIGSTFGDGDGATTFNVPNLSGRTIMGYDSTQDEFDTLTKTGGAKKHTLTSSEMPSHSHNFGGRWVPTMLNNAGTGTPDVTFWGVSRTGTFTHYMIGAAATTSPGTVSEANSTGNTGSNNPHNILQPYGVSKYIIKASGEVGELNSTVESALLGRTADLETKFSSRIPAFSARISSNQAWSGTLNWKKLDFTDELLDTTNDYNATLCRFTAPYSGLYEFDGHVTVSTTTGGPSFEFRVNGVQGDLSKNRFLGYNNSYDGTHWSDIMELNTGDYVEAWMGNANNTSITVGRDYGTRFMGKLLQRYY